VEGFDLQLPCPGLKSVGDFWCGKCAEGISMRGSVWLIYRYTQTQVLTSYTISLLAQPAELLSNVTYVHLLLIQSLSDLHKRCLECRCHYHNGIVSEDLEQLGTFVCRLSA